MEETELKNIYRKNPDIFYRKSADETIIVPISEKTWSAGGLFRLDEVGAFFWAKIDGKRSGEDILEAILDRYPAKRETAASDLLELLQSMERCGMIDRRED